MNNDLSSQKNKCSKLLIRLGHISTIIAAVTAIATFIISIKAPKLEAEMRVLEIDELTSLPEVEGLDSSFVYRGVSVDNLWRLNTRLINTGNATIIGTGSKKSLHEDVKITFPKDIQILDFVITDSSFNHKLEQLSENTIQLSFIQWRKGEIIDIVFYLSSESDLENTPLPKIHKRPIIDGDIWVKNYAEIGVIRTQPLLDYLSTPIPFTGRILAILVFGLQGLYFFVVFLIVVPIQGIKYLSWKIKNYESYKRFLNKQEEIKGSLLQDHLDKPWNVHDHYWNIFEGEKFPIKNILWNSEKELVLYIILGIIISLASISAIAGLIVI